MITECFVDGSYRKNGSACAVVIYRNRQEVFRTVKPVMASNSITPECEAILLAINLCYISNYTMPTIYTDSKVLCDQFKLRVNIHSKDIFFYISTLWEMEKTHPFILQFVKRDKVFVPDDMCKKFIDHQYRKFTGV